MPKQLDRGPSDTQESPRRRALVNPSGSLRAVLGIWGLGLLPGLFVTDVAMGRAFGQNKGWLIVVAWACLATAATVVVIRWRSMARRLGQWAGQFWLLSLTVLLALVVAEVFVRWQLPALPLHLRAPGLRLVWNPEADLFRGASAHATYTTCSRGFRGRDLPNASSDYRILCVGGGTTEGLYLDDEETWPARLQARLDESNTGRWWVGNVGYSSCCLQEHLAFLQESPLISDVDCVVLMLGADDYLRELLGLDVDDDAHWLEIRQRQLHLAPQPRWPHFRRLRLFGLLVDWRSRDTQLGFLADTTGTSYVQNQLALKFETEALAASWPLRRFRQRVQEVIATAHRRNVRLVLVTSPVLWDDVMTKLSVKQLRYAQYGQGSTQPDKPLVADALAAIERFHLAMFAASRGTDAEIVDLSLVCDGREELFFDDIHLNPAGCRIAAQHIAEHFLAAPAAMNRRRQVATSRDASGGD